MNKTEKLVDLLKSELPNAFTSVVVAHSEVTVESTLELLKENLKQLRDNSELQFNQLIDVCAVDYLYYGKYDWETEAATERGFSRGVEPHDEKAFSIDKPRFAVVYHLLSTIKNLRVRVKVFVHEKQPFVPSACDIWKAANWFEREAYDLYGILFDGHPDLRRILTDYGFIGHPFRKDFPLSGEVEMRYDATLQKVIYEPVDIEPRILVPKVIRDDNRYLDLQEGES